MSEGKNKEIKERSVKESREEREEDIEKGRPTEKEREIQRKYLEMQIADTQLKQMQKQLVVLDNQIDEIRVVADYLSDLSAIEVGSEMFVPLTQGVFVKAELKEKDKVLMNVGSEVVVTKTIEDGKELIFRQLKEVEKIREHLLLEFQKVAFRAEELEKELLREVS